MFLMFDIGGILLFVYEKFEIVFGLFGNGVM